MFCACFPRAIFDWRWGDDKSCDSCSDHQCYWFFDFKMDRPEKLGYLCQTRVLAWRSDGWNRIRCWHVAQRRLCFRLLMACRRRASQTVDRHHCLCFFKSNICRVAGRKRVDDETGRVCFSSRLCRVESGNSHCDNYNYFMVSNVFIFKFIFPYSSSYSSN